MNRRSATMLLFTQPHHDVVDERFRAAFPEVAFIKAASPQRVLETIDRADCLAITDPWYDRAIAQAALDRGQRLRWIQFTTVGIDGTAGLGFPEGVTLTNVRGIRTPLLSSHAMALMLGVMRGLRPALQAQAQHRWQRERIGRHLAIPEGKTMVLAGMGGIGRDIARKAKAFGMTVIGVSRAGKPGGAFDRVVSREALASVLPLADVLMLALPLDPETHHMIGRRELGLMKPGAILVNIARGALVDDTALIEALRTHRLAGAGLDVFDPEPLPANSPIWDLETVLMTPHLGGQGGDAQRRRLATLIGDNLRRFLQGHPLQNRITADGAPIGDDPFTSPPQGIHG